MGRAFEEAFKRAQAAKAWKSSDGASVGNLPDTSAKPASPAAEAWTAEVQRLTPLKQEASAVLAPGSPSAAAAAVQDDVAKSAGSSANGHAKRASTDPVLACPSRRRRHGHAPGAQTIPPGYDAGRLSRSGATTRHVPKGPPRYPHLQPPRVALPPPVDGVKLVVSAGAKLVWEGGRQVTASLLAQPADLGCRAQLLAGKEASTREVVMGFDFGTSSTKVVFGDRGVKQAYAVPFRDAPGLDAFLLPARLYSGPRGFSLQGGVEAFTDLKLALMAHPDNATHQVRVVAYLALAIREARGWLFSTHADSYARTKIVWTLTLGQPADQATPGAMTDLFQRLGCAAWMAAGSDKDITALCCRKAWDESAGPSATQAELDVHAMPEIAAQIYGFVNSNQFDPNARNIFLLADIGAGTVDTCLFRVVPGRGGTWSFEVYTAAVEPTGVMNLHRHRVAWWQEHLQAQLPAASLCAAMGETKLATDHQAHIPDSYQGYLSGVTVEFSGAALSPDDEFFKKHLMRQVQGRTLYRAFSAQLLDKLDLGNVPFFLCGGGSRHPLYRALQPSLRGLDGYSWLSASARALAIPGDLRADGLPRADFDRLSVAYGLSMLNLTSVIRAQQVPRLVPEASDQWRSHYVSKDQC